MNCWTNHNLKLSISLLEEYDIQTADDIQKDLKDLLYRTIKEMLEAEMDVHLGHENRNILTMMITGIVINVNT